MCWGSGGHWLGRWMCCLGEGSRMKVGALVLVGVGRRVRVRGGVAVRVYR
jgi:hypothetical protein